MNIEKNESINDLGNQSENHEFTSLPKYLADVTDISTFSYLENPKFRINNEDSNNNYIYRDSQSIDKNFKKNFDANFKMQAEDSESYSDSEYISSVYEYEQNKSQNTKSFLNKKTERFNIIEEEEREEQINLDKIDYRLDYYKKDFLKSFITYIHKEIQKLINNCQFCKKFGNTNLHMPNRDLYTGNTKEKDNKEFMNKTVEIVFKDYKNIEEIPGEKDGFSRQRKNENLFNRIHDWYDTLKSKKEKEIKYLKKYQDVEKLIQNLEMTIDEILDRYYESEAFNTFKEDKKIKYYDTRFYKERNRNFSLLEKGGFRKLVNCPFYSEKERKKNKNVY